MNKLTENYFRLTGYLQKYSYLVLSIGLISLGSWVCYFPSDLSRKTGIAEIIVGIFFGISYFVRKSKTKKL